MKIAKQVFTHNQTFKKEAILPLVPDEIIDEELDASKKTTFKLRTMPREADSPKYTFTMPILEGTDTVRRTLEWREKVLKIFRGLDLTDYPAQHNLIQELCRGTPLTAYKQGVQQHMENRHAQAIQAAKLAVLQNAGESRADFRARQEAAGRAVPDPVHKNGDIIAGLTEVVRAMCPYKVLEKQKRSMRRHMRKPADMKIRTFVNHLIRINTEELPHLPPYKANQQLTDDELVDIVCYGIPKSWLRKMDEHAFDPMDQDILEVVAFGERLEAAEDAENNHDKKPSATNSGKKSSTKKHKSSRSSSSGKWCHYHETDTHNTDECETLKRLKNKNSSDSKSRNMSWKRKSDDAKTLTKKDLAAIAKKAGREAVKAAKAECNAINKRKNDEEASDASASDDELSVAFLEKMDDEMKDIDKRLADVDFSKPEDGEISC